MGERGPGTEEANVVSWQIETLLCFLEPSCGINQDFKKRVRDLGTVARKKI